jgi:hypothetical protein
MTVHTSELLLALRAPGADWLAALIVALDEAMRDADCDAHQRHLLGSIIEAGSVPQEVSVAANERIARFEEAVRELTDLLVAAPEPAESADFRPKLTLCGGTAA